MYIASNATDLINELNPVVYTRKNNPDKTVEMGLIAQEVQEVLKKCPRSTVWKTQV